jgi:stage II sporulation protein D
MRFIILSFYLLVHTQLISQQLIKVGLYRNSVIKSAEVTLLGKNSQLSIGKDLIFFGPSNSDRFLIVPEGRHLSIYLNGFPIAKTLTLKIWCDSPSSCLFKPVQPDLRGNYYAGLLQIKNVDGNLQITNEVSMDIYLAGVLRGEIGFDKPQEVYRMHAIMSRTYATHYMQRHKSEGFHVCDQTHCQVYKGWFEYKPFHEAISKTTNQIVIDPLGQKAIECLFHSNCGGNTNASEQVWSAVLPYCRSVIDTFCLSSKNANWIKNISLKDFIEKLKIPNAQGSFLCDSLCYYNVERSQSLKFNGKSYDAVYLRNTLGLKSSWFNWECQKDSVTISGRGYGHGVGVCQEGAIRMAELGYSAEDILHFYYHDVIITERKKEEENGHFTN